MRIHIEIIPSGYNDGITYSWWAPDDFSLTFANDSNNVEVEIRLKGNKTLKTLIDVIREMDSICEKNN